MLGYFFTFAWICTVIVVGVVYYSFLRIKLLNRAIKDLISENKRLNIYRDFIISKYRRLKHTLKVLEDSISANSNSINTTNINVPSINSERFKVIINTATNGELFYTIKYRKNGKKYLRTTETYKNHSFLRKSAKEFADILGCELIDYTI